MAVLIVMSAVIMAIVYMVTRDSMEREAESRYEGVVLHANEKIRGVLSDVYVAAINNVTDIERDINDPDKLQAHLEMMVKMNMYMSKRPLHSQKHPYTMYGPDSRGDFRSSACYAPDR